MFIKYENYLLYVNCEKNFCKEVEKYREKYVAFPVEFEKVLKDS